MSDWQTTELGRLADFRNGLNYSAANAGSGLAVVGVSDFQDRSFVDFTTLAELDPSALSTPDALIRKDDILFVRSNGNRELIGRSLLVLSEPVKPTSHSGFTIRLRFTDKRADPRFFAYFLRGGAIRRHLSSQGGGTNINNLNQGILSRLVVPLPPLETQLKIAGILGAYDDLIEINRRRIAVMEEMGRELFAEWFTRRRFPGHEEVTIEATADGTLPAGWRWGSVSDLAACRGQSINPAAFPDEVFAHHSIPAFDDDRYAAMDAGRTIKSNKLEFQAPIILVSKLNPRLPRVWYIPDSLTQRHIASTEFVPLIPKAGRAAWLYAVLRSSEFTDRLTTMAGGTSTSHQRVKPKDILNTPIAIPSGALMDKADQALAPMFDMVRTAEAANRNLRAARDLLLSRLISGQVSVTQAERELEAA